MAGLFFKLHYWLVEQPAISGFEWVAHRTWGASPQFLLTSVFTYLFLTFLLHFLIPKPKSPSSSSLPSPLPLRLISAVHNVILLTLSITMAVGCSLSSLSQMPNPRWLFCFPSGGSTPPTGPTFFWAYIFYLSKLLEFSDTLLILLNPNKRLSFLHVYHHALVVVMSYLWLHSSQSLFPVALVVNASIHTLMYSYYLLCSLGVRPRWKRAVTDCQIVQFVFSFAVSLMFLWYHNLGDEEGKGCSGFGAWVFNAGFNASLLLLFLNFHSRNYGNGGREKKQH